MVFTHNPRWSEDTLRLWGDFTVTNQGEDVVSGLVKTLPISISQQNIEMRDTVRDPKFALQKELAFELERRLPEHFIPRYSMVMFHADIPYLTAQQRGEIQKTLLEEFTADAATLADVDIEAAVNAALRRLPPIDAVRNELSVRKP